MSWFIYAPVISYWTVCSLFHLMERLQILQQYRIQPRDDKKNKVSLRHVLFWVFLQHVSQMILGTIVERLEGPGEQRRDNFLISLCKFFVAMCVLDTHQYWLHRYMHVNQYLFNKFHSWHHKLYCPYAFGALYNHPVEGFLLDTVGAFMSMQVSRMDIATATIFSCFATIKTVCDHCGFYIPANPLNSCFRNNSRYHDYHHQIRGFKTNFQQPFFTFWDDWMGTQAPIS
eukprot:TRINITY_DN849_c0_g1_i1.p1 TRINITY_DN849_c0_g1~~TRINITY_DN849_c0_g1_i1.p1  ORF type:complete len:229 (-),score=32.66 TRINITY_DN849_c0_g1_i1:565-1251(-)